VRQLLEEKKINANKIHQVFAPKNSELRVWDSKLC